MNSRPSGESRAHVPDVEPEVRGGGLPGDYLVQYSGEGHWNVAILFLNHMVLNNSTEPSSRLLGEPRAEREREREPRIPGTCKQRSGDYGDWKTLRCLLPLLAVFFKSSPRHCCASKYLQQDYYYHAAGTFTGDAVTVGQSYCSSSSSVARATDIV